MPVGLGLGFLKASKKVFGPKEWCEKQKFQDDNNVFHKAIAKNSDTAPMTMPPGMKPSTDTLWVTRIFLLLLHLYNLKASNKLSWNLYRSALTVGSVEGACPGVCEEARLRVEGKTDHVDRHALILKVPKASKRFHGNEPTQAVREDRNARHWGQA